MQDMRAIVNQHNGDLRAFPKSYQSKLPPTPSSSYKAKTGCTEEICFSASMKEEEIVPEKAGPSEDRSVSQSNTASAINLTSIDHIVAAETVSETIKVNLTASGSTVALSF